MYIQLLSSFVLFFSIISIDASQSSKRSILSIYPEVTMSNSVRRRICCDMGSLLTFANGRQAHKISSGQEEESKSEALQVSEHALVKKNIEYSYGNSSLKNYEGLGFQYTFGQNLFFDGLHLPEENPTYHIFQRTKQSKYIEPENCTKNFFVQSIGQEIFSAQIYVPYAFCKIFKRQDTTPEKAASSIFGKVKVIQQSGKNLIGFGIESCSSKDRAPHIGIHKGNLVATAPEICIVFGRHKRQASLIDGTFIPFVLDVDE